MPLTTGDIDRMEMNTKMSLVIDCEMLNTLHEVGIDTPVSGDAIACRAFRFEYEGKA